MDAGPPRPDGGGEARGGRARSEWAYDMLHEAIREGTIEPGQRIMEVELSGWLRMSRTPVREAMRRLQAEGLLEYAPGGGMAVVLYDLRAIGEFYATRESLEGTAASLAAANADETEIRILSATLDAMRALPPDPRMHARENQAFHEQVYRAAHNRFLLKSLQSLLNFTPLLGRTTYNAEGRIPAALAEHAEIVAAIRARDPARAEEAARRHIRHSHESRVLVVSEDVRSAAQKRSLRQPMPGLTRVSRG
ncbi:GntR family transcriptional regulator [Roseomonas sp. NAR14]|uniref:GntR family transcriptional regulator n=1 Tax=Roseomonas acroporae TaxID=2937791 RepID=A0A9X1YFP3_9PROT|nr:GntR family transcriptional regulator [Roseomonas acroporae]MCK8787832.1 GntR family transcriptional regulator [Roseomonas acroporae]